MGDMHVLIVLKKIGGEVANINIEFQKYFLRCTMYGHLRAFKSVHMLQWKLLVW